MTPQTADSPAPVKLQTYGARPVYILLLAALTVLGVLGSAYVSSHERHVGILMWVLTGLYLLAFATVASLRIGFNTDTLKQRWLFNYFSVGWREVVRLEKTPRGYALRDAKGKDLALLFLLPPAAQQTIADAAIAHARLRPSRQAPAAPVLEQWERKGK